MSFDVPFFFVLNIYTIFLNNDKIKLTSCILERIFYILVYTKNN